MKQLNKFIYILILFALCSTKIISQNLNSNDLFNKENSFKYAQYLFYAQEYELALNEFDRIIFIDSTNIQSRIFYLKCLRYLTRYNEGIKKFSQLFQNNTMATVEAKKELCKLLIKGNYFDKAYDIVNKEFANNDTIFNFFKASILFYENKLKESENFLNSLEKNYSFAREYNHVILKYKNTKFKKPYLSFIFSSIIPGSGKIYAGDWKDGIVNFFMVVLPAYQAYRGFTIKGIRSPYGWIYGSIAFTFYGGNIYGSVKSANKYNRKKLQNLKNEIDIIFDKY